MISLERTLFSYFESTKNYIRSQPLNLGGVAGSGGGAGGPPGGFYGYLPQSRVAYDYSELATSGPSIPPPSGISISLVDNLNHIRYRVSTLEAGSGGGGTGRIDIYHNGYVVSSGIEQLNIIGDLNVTASGVTATIEHPVNYTEFYTVNVPTSEFSTDYVYISGSLNIYYNGLRQFYTDYTQIPASGMFLMNFVVPSGGKLVADYRYYESSSLPPTPPGGWGSSSWGSSSWGA